MKWEVERCLVSTGIQRDEDKLRQLLSEKWEPFAVTQSLQGLGYVYHFRRQVVRDLL